MAEAKKTNYGNESISSLKGADRVRKRPGVIFGSDGLDGCEHAVFEILSNSIDEAREGHGKLITVTRYLDHSIEVEDMGRGCPVDYNPKEKRFNWELVYCELYAGGKYNNLDGDNYEYSLGLNGLGACATQYSSRYMDVTVWRDGNKYSLHFERGEPVGKKGDELRIEPTDRGRKTGTRTRWLPDLDVFTDIDIPADYYVETLRRQAVVNAGITFRFKNEVLPGHFETQDFVYENGIIDYVAEIAGEDALTTPVFWETERRGRDREDKPEYKVKLSCACCFSNKVQRIEHYHNSSWLEHGGSPEKASKTAFVYAIDKYLKDNNKYQKGEARIAWQDIEDCIILVSNNFSTQTSYENQTKKAVNNRFIQEGMTEFLREKLQIFLLENPQAVEEAARQIKQHLPLEEVSIPSNSPYIRDLMTYDKPTVFFMDMEDVTQSIIYAYMYIDPLKAKEDRPISRLFSAYFGGDMSSLMFQEIREFRSFAYQVNARLKHPPLNRSEKPASFVMKLATQTDKMIDAMEVLENLVHDMPERPERVESVKQTIRNWVNNEYPTSRSLSLKIAGFRREGYESDPNKDYLEVIDRMTMEDILRFYRENIQDHLMIYAIVGNSKSMDMEKLSKFGQIVKVTKKDIYR